jgi:hypothetical protein
MRRIGRLLDRIGFVYDEGGSYRDHDDHRGHDYDDRYYDKDGSHGKNRKGAPQGQQPPVRLPRGTTTQQH